MPISKPFKVLVVFAIISCLLLFFSKQIIDFFVPPVKVSPPEENRPMDKTLIEKKDPKTVWNTFSSPVNNYQFNYRASYDIIPGDEKADILDSQKLIIYDTLLATITLVSSPSASQYEKDFRARVSSEGWDLKEEKITTAAGEGIMLTAKKQDTLFGTLVILNFPNQRTFVFDTRNFSKWVIYPEDFLTIVNSTAFF